MAFKKNDLVWVFEKFKGVVIPGSAYGAAQVQVKYKDDKTNTVVVGYVKVEDLQARS